MSHDLIISHLHATTNFDVQIVTSRVMRQTSTKKTSSTGSLRFAYETKIGEVSSWDIAEISQGTEGSMHSIDDP